MLSKKRVFSGKTVKSAINNGLTELGVTEDEVKITILEQPSRGLLGLFGAKDAKVEFEWSEEPAVPEPVPAADGPGSRSGEEVSAAAAPSDVVDRARSYLSDIVERMGVDATVERAEESGAYVLELQGKELGILIGRRGQTLEALQTLVNVYANRLSNEHIRIVLDAERFRERRRKTLESLSLRLANQVVRTKKEVVLEPMPSNERRIIHSRLQHHPKVRTFSKGEEPNRRVVITLK